MQVECIKLYTIFKKKCIIWMYWSYTFFEKCWTLNVYNCVHFLKYFVHWIYKIVHIHWKYVCWIYGTEFILWKIMYVEYTKLGTVGLRFSGQAQDAGNLWPVSPIQWICREWAKELDFSVWTTTIAVFLKGQA